MKRLLTDMYVKNAKTSPDGKPKKYTDGGGLYLNVTTSGKYWRYNYRFYGKQKTLALGSYPEISLRDARERHQEARDLLARGIDPSEHKKLTRAAERALIEDSFEAVALEWFAKFSHTWADSTKDKITGHLTRNVYPWLGGRPIRELDPPEILQCLRRIEARGALEVAHNVKQYMGQIFRYAVSIGKATRDPTVDLKGALPPPKHRNLAALTDPKDIGQLMRAIQAYKGTFETRIALQLSAYLFTRPGELRQMEWVEINRDTAQWLIPAERMKKRKAHIVPLSSQALTLLDDIKPLTGHRRHVVPSRNDPRKPMSNGTISQALRRMDYDNDTMTAHGFRALASTQLYEMGYSSEVIEKQLAHNVGSEVRRAYDRSQHIEQRTHMMQAWADYLDSLREGAQVIPFKSKANS